MSILSRLKKRLREKIYRLYLSISLMKRSRKPRVFLFGVPYHANLGDWAQTVCITRWIHRYLPEYRIVYTSLDQDWRERLAQIRRYIREKDILLMHSGYHLTDLYAEKSVYEEVARCFPDRIIRIMPQTVYFQDPAEAQACADVFNAHGNCIMLCRDQVSYKTGLTLFRKCRLHLYPDIVTSLIGVYRPSTHKRSGILFCIRNDKEAFYPREDIEKLAGDMSRKFAVSMSDTTKSIKLRVLKKNPEAVLRRELEQFAKYEVVVTDRYHGTIFSLVAGTPVIVLSSSDHKLSSGVKWFPESFKDYVFYADSLECVPALICEITATSKRPPLPPYFAERYFSDSLKDVLELD